MTPFQAIISGYKQCLRTKGRATRPEYIWFSVFNIAIFLAGMGLIAIANIPHPTIFIPLFFLALLIIPQVAIIVRRFHDIGIPGAAFLLVYVPIMGLIILILLAVIPGRNGENRYGALPQNDKIE